MRGRKPAAPELKVLRGETRPSRLNLRAPRARSGRPIPPSSLTPPERHVFRQVVHELESMTIRCSPDVLVIEVLAGMVVQHRVARAAIAAAGAWGPGARGGEVTSPWWRVYRDTAREITRVSAELGLTPSARSRVTAGSPMTGEADADGLLS